MLIPVLESEVRTRLLALVYVGLAPMKSTPEYAAPPANVALTVKTMFNSQTLDPSAAAVSALPDKRAGQLKDRYL